MDDNRFPARLLDGERILWSGQPAQGLRLTAQDCFLVPFSLLWGGFAVFWEFTVLHSKAPLFPSLWGIPLVLIGIYMIIGRFFVDAWLRRKTRYAVTSRRIVIARSGAWPKLTSVSLDRLPDMQLSERPDGTGTIRFGPAPVWGGRGWAMWMPVLDPTPQFIAIDDARRVFDMIQRTGRAPN